MFASIALCMGMFTVANANQTDANAADVSGHATAYRDVELYDGGPTRMEDKRDYDQIVVLGPMIMPLGLKFRYLRSLDDRTTIQFGGGYGSMSFGDVGFRRLLVRVARQRLLQRCGLDLSSRCLVHVVHGAHHFHSQVPGKRHRLQM